MTDQAPEMLLTAAEMAAVDRAAVAAGLPIDRLMQAAGLAVANVAHAAASVPASVAVLCGPGNNGGDAYVAARLLARRGSRVRVFALEAPSPDTAAARAAPACGLPIQSLEAFDGHADLIVDGLFGAGLSRAVDGAAAAAIERANASAATIVAVDVPSGLDADTGQPLGATIRAQHTVTFFRRKPGHLLWPGRNLCGRVHLAQIGLNEAHFDASALPRAFHNAPALFRSALAAPDSAAHKYRRGHVLVLSGPELATGASRLAAQAALNAGAGAVTLAGARDAVRLQAAHVTAIMLRVADSPEEFGELLATGRFSALVIGPAAGVDDAVTARLNAAASTTIPAVIDADALTCLSRLPVPFPEPRPAWVLTPHEGEFDRLFAPLLARDHVFAALPDRLKRSKLERARAAARLSGCIVVLKGPDTVIAAQDGRAAMNDNAGPELATAGSGDVLAGLIAAHLARGVPPFEAACAGVWLHGRCGAAYGAGLTAERLVDLVRPLGAWIDPPA